MDGAQSRLFCSPLLLYICSIVKDFQEDGISSKTVHPQSHVTCEASMFDLCITFTFKTKRSPSKPWLSAEGSWYPALLCSFRFLFVEIDDKTTWNIIFCVDTFHSFCTGFHWKPSPASLKTSLGKPTSSNYFATISVELFVAAVLWLPF